MLDSSTETGRSRATQAIPRLVASVKGTGNHRRPPRMYPCHAAVGVDAIALCRKQAHHVMNCHLFVDDAAMRSGSALHHVER